MIRKILSLLFVVAVVFILTGCNNETEEERLQREINESQQQVEDAVEEYVDTQKSVYEYNKYRDAVENAR